MSVNKKIHNNLYRKSASRKGRMKTIAEAEARLSEASHKVKNLKAVIKIFRERMDDGDPWPGEESATQN